MKILSIDTCTETVDVALVEDERLLASRRGSAPKKQLTKLIPFVAEVLEESASCMDDVNLIAVTSGPGSFTGIRLGIVTAKTLSQLKGIKIAPVNTIDAVALGSAHDGKIVAALDARKNEVFFSMYQKSGNSLERLEPYQKGSLEDFIEAVKKLDGENPVVTGSIWFRFSNQLTSGLQGIRYRTVEERFWTPMAEKVAILGNQVFLKGQTVDYLNLNADYMRDFEAVPPAPLVQS